MMLRMKISFCQQKYGPEGGGGGGGSRDTRFLREQVNRLRSFDKYFTFLHNILRVKIILFMLCLILNMLKIKPLKN